MIVTEVRVNHCLTDGGWSKGLRRVMIMTEGSLNHCLKYASKRMYVTKMENKGGIVQYNEALN